jgi:ligand-binding sensor domain-containing protein
VQSLSFRLISAAISTFLLAALITVIFLAVRDNRSTALSLVTPTASVASTTGTSVEETPAAPTPAAEDLASAETSLPIPAEGLAAPTGEMPAGEISTEETGTPTSAATSASSASISLPTPATISATTSPATPTQDASTGAELEEESAEEGTKARPSSANIVVPDAATATPQPTPIPPTFDPEEGPQVEIYSDGNFVNSVASMRSTLWAATSGGVVTWNKTTSNYVKFNTLDGLLANQTTAAVVCQLPGLGILFAGPLGIQIFDTQNGSWKTLNSSNSAMRYDDVSALWCSAQDGLLVVGYTRQGIDLFDARAGVWQYVGADEGLSAAGIRDIAVGENSSISGSTSGTISSTISGTTIWLATQNGLVSYADGNITTYTIDNSPLVDNRIEALAADGSGAIWLTSADTLYRTDGEEWDSYNASAGDFPSGRLIGLDVSSNGAIWIGSDQTQLCRFDPGVEGCINFYSQEEGMAVAPLTALMIDSDGEVYYTTAGGGISVFDGTSWRQLLIANEVAPGNTIHQVVQAPDDSFWVAGNGGATHFTPDTDLEVQSYTPANSPLPAINVRVILPTEAGVWFGTDGAAFFDGSEWTTYGPDDGLSGTVVQAITADAQNRIWLGTDAGLSIWTGTTFFNLDSSNGLPDEDITALQSDGDAVWIGTRSGGLLRFQDNQLQLFNRSNSSLPGDSITLLTLAPNGNLLIGSDQGLARYSNDELTPDEGLAEEAIVALAAAASGELWAATAASELLYFNGIAWEPLPTDKLPAPEITTLMIDADGSLWIGAAQGGLARYIP